MFVIKISQCIILIYLYPPWKINMFFSFSSHVSTCCFCFLGLHSITMDFFNFSIVNFISLKGF
ncbi:uncharacterized protein MELLADRAFT_72300 [Melampsora larici-populina 98AG31]|uniref:Uncharacterized protein n=1 Tax=Melampsora larici-populina (strain 98AG31 / pathotype 3-4-7) TaxID=747676 RepID=F4RS86_MELLP|nr:uncharacterized protein MELLADRAFT_72300 [Melampsora larici-populina 98AG31]EGG04821.1 hypothetical protein MELLADRAFT_72300 [Melampsora larici-populina 98AG31]